VRENGPLALHAEVNIAGDGRVFRATRCRCGASQRTPFCDSAHVTASFRSTGEPVAAESQPLPERAGLVKLIPLPNGPLLLNSNEEICTGTGNTLNSTTKTALCRCGQSANKLYCDGTHVRVGFTAEWR
jgi:CDGSH-type Zn-finger protein